MAHLPCIRWLMLSGGVALGACTPDGGPLAVARPGSVSLQSYAMHQSPWSEPVNLGAPVNSSANEQNSSISPHGLSIYVSSNRPGGVGGNDIWVVQRACVACPWNPEAVNLGPTINNPGGDGGVSISQDGHTMLYQSARAGGFGGTDLWMSHRDDPNDDFGWEAPVNLGPLVNTAAPEQSPEYVTSEGMLYFNRGNVMALGADFWRAPMTRTGVVLGLAEPVPALNLPMINDAAASITPDGRELIFWSFPRPDALGDADLYVSTRISVNHPWSAPAPVPGAVNSEFGEVAPSISHDGRTMIFFSNRPGGLGGFDLWMSTRSPGGHE